MSFWATVTSADALAPELHLSCGRYRVGKSLTGFICRISVSRPTLTDLLSYSPGLHCSERSGSRHRGSGFRRCRSRLVRLTLPLPHRRICPHASIVRGCSRSCSVTTGFVRCAWAPLWRCTQSFGDLAQRRTLATDRQCLAGVSRFCRGLHGIESVCARFRIYRAEQVGIFVCRNGQIDCRCRNMKSYCVQFGATGVWCVTVSALRWRESMHFGLCNRFGLCDCARLVDCLAEHSSAQRNLWALVQVE